MPGTGFKLQKPRAERCHGVPGLEWRPAFLKGHESHDYCKKTKFLPVHSWDQHYDFSVTLAILILLAFSQYNTSYSPTIDETSRLAIAGLMTSPRAVSCVG